MGRLWIALILVAAYLAFRIAVGALRLLVVVAAVVAVVAIANRLGRNRR